MGVVLLLLRLAGADTDKWEQETATAGMKSALGLDACGDCMTTLA